MGCKIRLDLLYDPATNNKYWFSLPDTSVLTSASDIAALSLNISQVIRWDPTSQSEETWNTLDATGTNFTIVPGEAYVVVITASTIFNIVGAFNGNNFNLGYDPANFNHNWLSLPLPLAAGSAAELVQEMANVTKVGKYDAANDTYQSWFKLNGTWMGEDFTLSPGVGIVISLGDTLNWTPNGGLPSVSAPDLPDTAYESIAVDFSAVAQDSNGIISSYAWDFNGDGVFDDTGQNVSHTYSSQGTYHPTVLVTDDNGFRAVNFSTITISSLNVDFSVSGFSPSLSESANIEYILPLDGLVSLNIYAADGSLVKNLLVSDEQTAGTQSVNWDGTDNSGQQVGNGTYYAVIQYTVNGHTSIYDTRTTSGGIDISDSVANISFTEVLSPLEGEYVDISYTLPENSLVSVSIKDVAGNIIRQLLDQVSRAAGNHTETWDGIGDNGAILPSGSVYLVEISAISLASNSLVVSGQAPELTSIAAAPQRFSPVVNPYGLNDTSEIVIDFSLSKNADITATVLNEAGTLIRSISVADLPVGTNQIAWNGRDNEGIRMADGNYTIRLQAQDNEGNISEPFSIQAEIYY